MASGKLQIVLHAGKDLRDVKHFGTMDPYAIVWITGDDQIVKKKTDIAKKGSCDPLWNCRMYFDIPMNQDSFLIIEIKHGGKLFDRKIGEVRLRFADLLAGNSSGEEVSYKVTTPSGEDGGEIILSLKLTDYNGPSTSTSTSTSTSSSTSSSDGGGSPATQEDGKAKKIAKRVLTKVVTGIAAAAASMVVDDDIDY